MIEITVWICAAPAVIIGNQMIRAHDNTDAQRMARLIAEVINTHSPVSAVVRKHVAENPA